MIGSTIRVNLTRAFLNGASGVLRNLSSVVQFARRFNFQVSLNSNRVITLSRIMATQQYLKSNTNYVISLVNARRTFNLTMSTSHNTNHTRSTFLHPVRQIRRVCKVKFTLVNKSRRVSRNKRNYTNRCQFLQRQYSHRLRRFIRYSSTDIISLKVWQLHTGSRHQ